MTDNKQEAILRQVRALLTQANGTPYEAEADTFRAKAEELMNKYHIESWMLAEQKQDRREPIRKDLDMSWYMDYNLDGGAGDDVKSQQWRLFLAVCGYCNVVVAPEHVSWTAKTIPAFGLPIDLEYAELLFISLLMQMGRKLKPEYSSKLSLGHNIYNARSAGMSYAKIALWLGKPEWEKNGKPVDHGIMAREYKAYMKEAGIMDPPVTQQKRYLFSFMYGWVNGVQDQFNQHRKEQIAKDEAEGSGSLLPALRDARQMAIELRKQTFAEKEADRTGRTYRGRSRTVDRSALDRGTSLGRQADISRSGSKVSGSRRKELN